MLACEDPRAVSRVTDPQTLESSNLADRLFPVPTKLGTQYSERIGRAMVMVTSDRTYAGRIAEGFRASFRTRRRRALISVGLCAAGILSLTCGCETDETVAPMPEMLLTCERQDRELLAGEQAGLWGTPEELAQELSGRYEGQLEWSDQRSTPEVTAESVSIDVRADPGSFVLSEVVYIHPDLRGGCTSRLRFSLELDGVVSGCEFKVREDVEIVSSPSPYDVRIRRTLPECASLTPFSSEAEVGIRLTATLDGVASWRLQVYDAASRVLTDLAFASLVRLSDGD